MRFNGAAAVLDDKVLATTDLAAGDAAAHVNAGRLLLIVIQGTAMMDFFHVLYEHAADEA
ncbi:hypothetical protein EAH79_11510 [Sphingomonas koreensis]|nr:hypothetical protein EAH79_11510 [Sphingomonas koreensis]